MFATSTRGPIWPARLSYLAAGLFTAASTGTNLIYGWSKGADTASSLVWAAVSLAVSVVFALSWPAFIVSLDRRQWARAVMVLIALIITGSYSIVAALGSASGGRVDAAANETAAANARKNAQAAYDKATADLAALKPTRPLAELEALVAVPAPCRIVVNLQGRQTICAHPTSLTAELGRAKRRAELEQKIEAARIELSAPATRQANSDAAALAGYFGALGWKIEADTLNKLLALLAVLVIELGGGASLAVGMALSEKTSVRPDHIEPCDGTATVPPRDPWGGTVPRRPATIKAKQRNLVDTTETALLRSLQDHGGTVTGGRRALGRNLGVSATQVNRVLDKLVAAGVVAVEATRQGSVIRLLVSGTA